MDIFEIKNRYGIDTDDLGKIRGELRKLLKENHPDNNEGYDINYFEQIKQDLDYVEKEIRRNTSTSIDSFFNALMKNVQDYPVKNRQKEFQEELEKSINKEILSYKQNVRVPRYSLVTITAVLTFLWMFPEKVASHPIVKFFWGSVERSGQYELAICFAGIWFCACMILAFYWMETARKEQLEKDFLERIKHSSVQNDIFMSFIAYRKEEKEFSKNEFIEYIRNYVCREIISKNFPKGIFGSDRIFLTEIIENDEIIIQNLANIIIDRALSHGIIQKWNTYSLLDYYKIIK